MKTNELLLHNHAWQPDVKMNMLKCSIFMKFKYEQ